MGWLTTTTELSEAFDRLEQKLEDSYRQSDKKLSEVQRNADTSQEFAKQILATLQSERQSRIDDLKAQIETQQIEIRRLNTLNEALTDRLLERHNIAPTNKSNEREVAPFTTGALTPWGAIPEHDPALKQSWMNEEMTHLINEMGMDLQTAKEQAEHSWQLKDAPFSL